jgi:rare lipoprotein A
MPHGIDKVCTNRTGPWLLRGRFSAGRDGCEVIVRINDRGPWARARIIDLSRAAAAALDMLEAGEAPVVILPM